MKFSIKRILFSTISLMLLIDLSLQVSNVTNKKKKKNNFKRTEEDKAPEPAPKEPEKETPVEAAASGSEKSEIKKSNENNHDINNYPKIIEAAPYVVQSCDQVLYIPGKIITNLEDFSTKKDAFFTINIYFANYFESKDPKTLKESISLQKLNKLPQIILGTKSCIEISNVEKSFNICLESKEVAEQIIAAFDNYFKCRIGNNLAATDENNKGILKILKDSCLGLDIQLDSKKFQDPNEASAYYESALNQAFRKIAKKIGADLKKEHKDRKEKENNKIKV